jgi:hypothetical protein
MALRTESLSWINTAANLNLMTILAAVSRIDFKTEPVFKQYRRTEMAPT